MYINPHTIWWQSSDCPLCTTPPVACPAKVPAWQVGVGHYWSPPHTPTARCGPRCSHCPPYCCHHLPPSVPLSSSYISLTATRNKQWVLTEWRNVRRVIIRIYLSFLWCWFAKNYNSYWRDSEAVNNEPITMCRNRRGHRWGKSLFSIMMSRW